MVLWSVGAAAAMVLAVLCGLMWSMDRRDRASLMLCVLGVATAGSAYVELGVMYATTPAEFGAWVRWYHLPLYPALIAQVLFKNDGTNLVPLEGGQLVEVGARVQLIDMQEQRVAEQVFFPDHRFVGALAPLGDGKRFVAQAHDGTLRIYSFDAPP